MKINSKYLETILKDWKYILNTVGSKKHQDWLIFDNDKIFAFNGYFYISTDFKAPGSFAINANCISILDSPEVDVMWKETRSMIKAGNKKIEYDYPFTLQDKITDFYYDTSPTSSLVPQDIDYIFKFVCHPKDSINFSNVYVKDGYMYGTDSFRVIKQKTNCVDTTLPYGVQKIVNEEIRSIADNDNGVTLDFGEYKLSAVKTLGSVKEILPYITKIPTNKIVLPGEAIDLLFQVKKFDFEHKKKDVQAIVECSNNKLVIKAEGFKSAFEAELENEYSGTFRFSTNPDHLIEILQLNTELFYDPGLDYVVAQDETITHYLAVGK